MKSWLPHFLLPLLGPASCYESELYATPLPYGFSLDVSSEYNSTRLQFEVICPENSWLRFAFSLDMSNADKVEFDCSGGGTVQD